MISRRGFLKGGGFALIAATGGPWGASEAFAQTPLVAASGDAFIAHAPSSDEWSIGSANIVATYRLGTGHELLLEQIVTPLTARQWTVASGPDTFVSIAGFPVVLSEFNAGISFVSAEGTVANGGVQLVFTYASSRLAVRIFRYYACYPQSPVIETWTRIEADRLVEPVTAFTAWQATMALGTVRWLNGLRGDAAGATITDAFALGQRDLSDKEVLDLGADLRSSEQFVPVALVDGEAGEFVVGSMWSGSWHMSFGRQGSQLTASLSYPAITTAVAPGQPVEFPHGFFGVTLGTVSDVSAGLRPFIDNGIRQGRPFTPLVTYNTWFAYGTSLDEGTLEDEIDRNANLGVELFVLDAGWYVGSGANGPFDYEAGLGTWQEDLDKFPDGLRALRDRAHARGMMFGLWVEPERVNQDTVGVDGLAQESWLATNDGDYGSPNTAQICFGASAGREWVLHQLQALIDRVQPDYLKWDNNFWIDCNRPGHDHGAGDGNFAQVQGLYGTLQSLQDQYPNLLIENVSGGGNRLDFGWLRYSDTAWMDDRTHPSVHVRHNLEGLSAVFPPGYLLSFVIDSEEEPLVSLDTTDIPMFLRSRTPGILGLTYQAAGLSDSTLSALSDVIQLYKTVRDVIGAGSAALLTSQANEDGPQDWDALQVLDPNTGNAVIWAFWGQDGDPQITIQPRGLPGDAVYQVTSVDAGLLGSSTGIDLVQNGISVVQGNGSSSHVLILTP